MSTSRAGDLRIGVLGLGHVGLPTAIGFADLGWEVIGFDDDRAKGARIADGEAPFFELGIGALLHKHLRSGRFRVAADADEAITQSDVLFVCVGTPQREDGSADLSQVESVARTIAAALNGYKVIVEKSTTPVRTAEQIDRTIRRYRNGDYEFDVAVNPEFMREGTSLSDFFNPDRIVIGVDSDRARDLLLKIYEPLVQRLGNPGPPNERFVITNLNTAEIIKHAANAFLATKISFINMIADLCDAVSADVLEVARGLGMDPRIGSAFLQAGVGYGGYCLPKDLRAFVHIAEEHVVDFSLLKEVARINDRRIDRFFDKVRQALWVVRGKTIGVLGLAFKPGTDDVREAPSLKILERCLATGAMLRVHDPQAADNIRQLYRDQPDRLVFCSSPYEVAEGAHALLLLTEWDEYRVLDLAKIKEVMEVPILIDGRNLYDPATVRSLGFEYISVGRP